MDDNPRDPNDQPDDESPTRSYNDDSAVDDQEDNQDNNSSQQSQRQPSDRDEDENERRRIRRIQPKRNADPQRPGSNRFNPSQLKSIGKMGTQGGGMPGTKIPKMPGLSGAGGGSGLSGTVMRQGAAAGGRLVVGFFATPAGWVVIAIAIILLLFLFIYLKLGDNEGENVTVRLDKSAPPHVENKEPITYALTVTYTGNPTQIIVTDPIPDNATFVSAGQNAVTLDASGQPTTDPALVKTVKWTISVSSSTNGTISTGATSLAGFFTESAQTYNVPVALLMAINKLEAPGVLDTWIDADVAKFSMINWWFTATPDDRTKGWAFNQCDTMACANGSDVQGIMQFEIATWDWVGAGLTFSDGHTPNRLYPKDAIYAAGNLVRIHAAEYDAAYGTQAADWPEEKVRKVATAYCTGNIYGDSSSSACTGGGGPYDDVVWGYYQEFLSK